MGLKERKQKKKLMKIKLKESQYKRLLVENDKDFLDGEVSFRHIGNKVSKFIIKLYNYLYQKKGNTKPRLDYIRMIRDDFSLTTAEAQLLAYNYEAFSKNAKDGDYEKFLGEPLTFYGKFKFETSVPVFGQASGWVDGTAYGYATSYEDFIENLEDGDIEDIEADWNNRVDWDEYNIEWEVDGDYAYDRLRDEIEQVIDDDEVKDRISIVD